MVFWPDGNRVGYKYKEGAFMKAPSFSI